MLQHPDCILQRRLEGGYNPLLHAPSDLPDMKYDCIDKTTNLEKPCSCECLYNPQLL